MDIIFRSTIVASLNVQIYMPYNTAEMYSTDLANFTGNTTEAISKVKGGMLCAWDDAAETDAGESLASSLKQPILSDVVFPPL